MRPIEDVVCESKLEARMRERYWCEMYNPNLNTRKSYVSGEDNKERIKQYYEDNKDRYKQYHKEYRDENKDKFKQYYQENRDKRLKYQKEYIKTKLRKGIYIPPEDLTEEIT